MLRALAAGETDAEQMSHLAQGILKRKQPQLQQALEGRFTQAQRWILTELLDQYEHVEAALQSVAERIRQEVENSADPFVAEAVQLLDTIPGVGETVAQIIVAEIGVDMERFPTDHHLASWAGVCPGNNESAGKRKSGKTTKGSRYLRAALVQAAWAASHQKETVSGRAVQTLGETDGQEESAGRRGPQYSGDRLSRLADPHAVSGVRGRLLRAPERGQAAQTVDSPIGNARE